MVLLSFVVSVGVYFDLLSMDEEERSHVESLFSWVPVDSLQDEGRFGMLGIGYLAGSAQPCFLFHQVQPL